MIRASLILATVLSIGCATGTATIYRPDAPPLETVIVSSDADSLRVRTEEGAEMTLGQLQVSDIDHPGNVGIAGGLAIVAFGLALIAPGSSDPYGEFTSAFRTFGFLFAASGAISAVGGGWQWGRSRKAAGPFNDARPPPSQIPRPMRGSGRFRGR